MEFKDYERIDNAIDAARDSVVPFPVVDNGGLTVVGDANETRINKHDFKIRFRVPAKKDDGTVEYIRREKEFKDVFLTPRQDTKVARLIARLFPYFRKIEEDGGLSKMTREEMMSVYERFDDEVFDLVYDVTASVLGIDKALKDYMNPVDAIDAAIKIMEMYPEVVNEADTFFG